MTLIEQLELLRQSALNRDMAFVDDKVALAISCLVNETVAELKKKSKKGKWIVSNKFIPTRVCSICSAEYDYIAGEKGRNSLNYFKYCPKCGAEMES